MITVLIQSDPRSTTLERCIAGKRIDPDRQRMMHASFSCLDPPGGCAELFSEHKAILVYF